MANLPLSASAFSAGMLLSLSLIMAIGPQNAHVLRMGLTRQHLWLTVAVCALADVTLILLGVFGLSKLGGLSPKLHGALLGAGIVFLLFYGWQAMQRAWCATPPSAPTSNTSSKQISPAVSRRQAVATALAFSWLNPHAWIDTAVLIGTASLAYQTPTNTIFGLGAVTGSFVWFVGFGGLVCWLGHRLNGASIWRWVDAIVAVMMWGIAGVLFTSLVT